MPDPQTLKRVATDRRAGRSAATQAGEFVREELHHLREGKHGARSSKQAIAIGLSKARRAGVKLDPPKRASKALAAQVARDDERGLHPQRKVSATRSRSSRLALVDLPHAAASHLALSRHAHEVARKKQAVGERKQAPRRGGEKSAR
jgi:hypothetical protein